MNKCFTSGFCKMGLGVAMAGAMTLASAETLTLSGFPGTIGANIHKAFLDTYKGDEIKYIESWDSARFTTMQAHRNRPKLDVVTFTDLTLPLAAKAGLLEPLDPKVVTELADVDPAVKAEQDMGVTFGYGCQGILYNSKYVKEPITSWGDLLRDDLKGHVSAPSINYSMVFNAIAALAELKGGSLKDPKEGLDLYRQIRLSGPGLWDTENQAIGWLKTGEVWVTPYHSGNALTLIASDPDLKDLRFVPTKEGAFFAPLMIAAVKNGPAGGDAAGKFINHTLSVASQEAFAQLNKVRPANNKAHVPEDAAKACPTASELRQVDVDYLNQNRSKIVDEFNLKVNG